MRRVTADIDAYNNRTTYSYKDKGQKVQTTDAKNRTTYYSYGELGKLSKVINPNAGETSYTYDAKGHTTQIVTPNGVTFTYVYDGFGRLIEEANPDKGLTTYTYDEYDKKLTETDADMQSISIDGEVLLDNIHMNNTQISSYHYADGTTHTREYDLNERAIKHSYPSFTEDLDYDEVSSITAIMTDNSKKLYGYDNLNRLTTYDKNSTAYQ